ncbi:hypothetical protein ACFO9Q_05620 [Paenibacillus sp. GCM10023252]
MKFAYLLVVLLTLEFEYTDDVNGGYLYLKLPAEIDETVGSRGKVTEFLVRNASGKFAERI